MISLPPIPARIAKLPRDERGYPVPWFVAWLDNGKPEFRCADPEKLVAAVKENRCWVCGDVIFEEPLAFVIGPMCAVNRNTAEPPCHRECAEFSVKACPWLSMPKAQRREANMPEGVTDPAGMAIRRNPGVSLIWITERYRLHRERRGYLFELRVDPIEVLWFAEGRKATRAEVLESMNTGLPFLRKVADEHGEGEMLDEAYSKALLLLPLESA